MGGGVDTPAAEESTTRKPLALAALVPTAMAPLQPNAPNKTAGKS